MPDLVEYPSVVAGTFPPEFLELPEEVLTTTMIHHQHYFPVDGRRRQAEAGVPRRDQHPSRSSRELIARNAERVLTARLRDARFFWDADRKVPLESRIERLDTLLFHKKLGSYTREGRAHRAAGARGSRATRSARRDAADARGAGRRGWRKADLATDMVREFTELQGTMGGIYAREEGQPEAVWKAIYYHYLPVGVEADAPPTRAQLGDGGRRRGRPCRSPTSSTRSSGCSPPASGRPDRAIRTGCGGRRTASFKILVDLPELTGLDRRGRRVGALLDAAAALSPSGWPLDDAARAALTRSSRERLDVRARAARLRRPQRARGHCTAVRSASISPLDARRMLEVLPEFTGTPEFQQLADGLQAREEHREGAADAAFARPSRAAAARAALTEPAEHALLAELERRRPVDRARAASRRPATGEAFAEAAAFGPAVDRFFTDVLVMADDPALRAGAAAADDSARAAHPPARGHFGDCSSDGVVTIMAKTASREEDVGRRRRSSKAAKAATKRRSEGTARRSTCTSSAAARPTAIGR